MDEQKDTSVAVRDATGTERRAIRFRHRFLLGISLFNAIGALFGGTCAFLIPEFMGASLLVPLLQEIPIVGPFIDSLAWPAAALLLFICLPQSVAAAMLLRGARWRYIAALICNTFLIIFTTVEILVMPNPLSWAYLLLGVVGVAVSVAMSKPLLP